MLLLPQLFFFAVLLAQPLWLTLFYVAMFSALIAFIATALCAGSYAWDFNNCLTDLLCSCFPTIPGSTGSPDWTIIALTVTMGVLSLFSLIEFIFCGVLLVNQQYRALLRTVAFQSPQVQVVQESYGAYAYPPPATAYAGEEREPLAAAEKLAAKLNKTTGAKKTKQDSGFEL